MRTAPQRSLLAQALPGPALPRRLRRATLTGPLQDRVPMDAEEPPDTPHAGQLAPPDEAVHRLAVHPEDARHFVDRQDRQPGGARAVWRRGLTERFRGV